MSRRTLYLDRASIQYADDGLSMVSASWESASDTLAVDDLTAAKLAYAEARVRYWLTEPPAQSEEQRCSMSSDLLYTENAMLALARKERGG